MESMNEEMNDGDTFYNNLSHLLSEQLGFMLYMEKDNDYLEKTCNQLNEKIKNLYELLKMAYYGAQNNMMNAFLRALYQHEHSMIVHWDNTRD
tara:strand:- start:50 stop:328 length:279 start_codon:yes stop_codon:yes gene_type:complete